MEKITDKYKAIAIYEEVMGYKNGIPEFDEGIYGVLFGIDRHNGLTKKEIEEIASNYENEDYPGVDPLDLTPEELEEILKEAQELDDKIREERKNKRKITQISDYFNKK